jgi:hypothetical protein
MRWLSLSALALVAACSMMHPAPAPKAPTATAPPAMMDKAEAQRVLTEHGYTSPALVPSQTDIGGWSGTAMQNGQKVNVTVDKSGQIVP